MNMLKTKGFTIVEAVVSIVIVGIIWIAALNVFIISTANYSVAKHKTQASLVAQGAIERLRKLPFTGILGSTSTVSLDSRGTPDNYTDDFNGTQVITVYNDSAYYKRVVVDISWNEIMSGKGKTVHEYLGTYIANDPQVN